ncbi:MAG TPA: flagellar biosynthetic protein FliR [Rickettsiales bacterium]|nr:flagellar biosynthetic protein FliR [Rickettsiales bacterium]
MLEHFLVSQIFAFLLIFCRVGSGIMALPGFGESYVPVNIRLCFALLICLILTPALGNKMPPLPSSSIILALLIANEVLVGIFIGSLCKILISVMHIAGSIIAMQAGVSSAVVFDPNQRSQGPIIGNFLSLVTLVMIFGMGLHYLMLRAVVESYVVFVPGHFPPLNDFVGTIVRLTSQSFTMAVQLSAPLIIAGTLLFLGAGILARLMPTVQIFFLITAPQVLIGFFILITAFSALMLFYMDFYREKIMSILGYL